MAPLNWLKLLSSAVIFFIFGCTSTQPISNIELIDKNTIKFESEINAQSASTFASLLAQNSESIDTLVINSGGGEVFSGIAMGELVFQHQLTVIVEGGCASSCANYIVPAAKKTIIEEGAMLGWHGGALQVVYLDDLSKNQALTQYIKNWQQKEAEFFNLIKVNQAITIIGMLPSLSEKRDAPLFSYDIETLKKLGLKRIHFKSMAPSTHSKDGKYMVQIFTLTSNQLDTLLEQHQQHLNEYNGAL